jgi:hypothetical protein
MVLHLRLLQENNLNYKKEKINNGSKHYFWFDLVTLDFSLAPGTYESLQIVKEKNQFNF